MLSHILIGQFRLRHHESAGGQIKFAATTGAVLDIEQKKNKRYYLVDADSFFFFFYIKKTSLTETRL